MSYTYADLAQRVREVAPLTHCLTNSVVPEITANVLLAVGASPAMVNHPEESRIFAGIADALLINVGNITDPDVAAMRAAIEGAQKAGTPWVLDPVAVGGLPVRTEFARSLVSGAYPPAAIRGNASEILGLAGHSGRGRGVDSGDSADDALEAARELASRTGAIVAISGPTDIIVSEHTTTHVRGGHELMPQVIGTGCSLGAVVASYLGVHSDDLALRHAAVVAAHAHCAGAGTRAGADPQVKGPGTFAPVWLDCLVHGPESVEACTIAEGAHD
ncbi:hydroxyethylthiazole kinase [Corynebacterium tapiri]|uniref:Hydroxyethylthiazole kinase n=1 Tax=Corynebacterium tapiri TaxID=1448266 RepID=A0A5C4U5Q4_9CORY|nr:hydroxyethylthiazole kinase [Corynebacterium tapiri]TNL98590.1 hydroxyethylthiazole kinase [Corynebacterium tapiri]